MKANKRFSLKIDFIVAIVLIFVFMAFSATASAAVIIVPSAGNETIQQAINNATTGDTILVNATAYAGTTETVVVNKSDIIIRSVNGTAVVSAGGASDHVVNITDQTNVTLEGFEIRDADGQNKDVAGIYMNTTSDCTISNSVIMNISTAGSYDAYGVLVETAINLTSTDTTVCDIHGNNNSIGILIEEGMNVDFDPTMIENVTASNGTAFGLLIEAINLSFTDTTIRDVDGNESAYGILMNATNVTFDQTVIENVTAPNGDAFGIFAVDILINGSFTDTTIRDVTGNASAVGILGASLINVTFDQTVIERVTALGVLACGVMMVTMQDGSFTDTTIRDVTGNASAYGIYASYLENVSFTNGEITNCGHGVWIVVGSDNSIAGFIIRDNTLFDTGVHLETDTSNTTVCRNCLYNNVLQAWDNGTNNSWDGNYWSPPPGITNYTIQGAAGSVDNTPLESCPLEILPVPVPALTPIGLLALVGILSGIAALTLAKRKRR